MLTADLAMSWQRGARIEPKLIDAHAPEHQRLAADLIEIVRNAQQNSRARLEAELDNYTGTGTDYKIVRGLVKLLLDNCKFEILSAKDPEQIRHAVFRTARRYHPVISSDDTGTARAGVLAEAAAELGCTIDEVERGLFADLTANGVLTEFIEPTPVELLERYNLAQAQALLYRAVEMRLTIPPQSAAEARRIFTLIKAYRLIHSITGDERHGYNVRLTGPVSMFHRSQKYGIQMAVFLPALLLCRSWHMQTEILVKGERGDRTLLYELASTQTDLRSHLSESLPVTNKLVERLFAGWSRLRSRWTINSSAQVIDLGGSTFVPDAVAELTPESAEAASPAASLTTSEPIRVFIEVLGFWTPKDIAARIEEFARRDFKRWILIASDELRCSRDEYTEPIANVVVCKAALDVRRIEDAVLQVAHTS